MMYLKNEYGTMEMSAESSSKLDQIRKRFSNLSPGPEYQPYWRSEEYQAAREIEIQKARRANQIRHYVTIALAAAGTFSLLNSLRK